MEKDIVCRLCGDAFNESDLDEFRDLGEEYHYENGQFFCPDCWDAFSRMTLEEQAAELLDAAAWRGGNSRG